MNPEVQKLVSDFAKYEVARDEASTGEDGARYTSLSHQAFKQLTSKYGDDGREALTSLFSHEDPRIRSIAAAYLLRYKHDDAVEVLREIGKGRGMIAFECQEAIERWKDGTWELDPEPNPETM